MYSCISYWSVEGGMEGTCTVDDALAQAKAAGFAGLEFCVGEKGVITPSIDQKTCEQYREAASKAGLVVQTLASGMSWGCSPTHIDPKIREKSIRIHRDALQRAKWLGCSAMLFVPGAILVPWDDSYPRVEYGQAARWARDAIGQLLDDAERFGIDLCIENVWNGLFYSPIEFTNLLDEFRSDRIGAYLDIGNLMGIHQWPPDWIRHLGHRIKRVHIKDYKMSVGGMNGFCELLDGDVPWTTSMKALREVGYNKTIVAEMMPYSKGLLDRTSQAMQKIVKL